MELEEMKAAWAEMSEQVEKQKKLTDKLILNMTEQRYERGLNKIRFSELGGTVGCFIFAMLILWNFDKFGTGYVLGCAVVSFLIFLVSPLISLSALYRMKRLPQRDLSYKDLLTWYAAGKKRFLMVQKVGFYLSFVLMFTSLPVILRMKNGKVTELSSSTWLWLLVFGLPVFVVFARWVYRYYERTMSDVEGMLKDLEDNS